MAKSSVLAIAVLAVWSATSPVFAQTFDAYGNVFPMQYDAQGGQHYHIYGYSGPMNPAMPHETKNVSRLQLKARVRSHAD
jgi:hypothetical protein